MRTTTLFDKYMEKVIFRNLDNSELWEIIDKNVDHILIHQFDPHQKNEWWTTSISVRENFELKNVSVRQMQFDLSTNLAGLKNILKLNSLFLNIYQFNRPIPNTLQINELPEQARESILKQNGLEYIILNQLEDTIIESVSLEFINKIRQNPLIKDRIVC